MAQTARPTGIRVWLLAARPATLPAAIAPVLVGSAVAAREGGFQVLPFLGALLASMLIQVGTNLANDYFDFKKGADTPDRLGPVRVTQSGLIAPEAVRRAMILTFVLAALIGLYLVIVGGWPILAIGLASIAAGVLYTGGPYPLAYHGLGDVFVYVFFGLLAVTGTTYLHSHAFSLNAFLLSLSVGATVTAILVVNNLRDVDTDRVVGKRTLAVMIGRRATRVEYTLLLVVAYAVPLVLVVVGRASAWMLLPLASLPLAVRLLRSVWREQGRPLNLALKGTGQLHLLLGVLLSAASLLGLPSGRG